MSDRLVAATERVLLVSRNELVGDGFYQQFGRQQTLAQEEVVECLLVKFTSERKFSPSTEFAEFHVTVEIGGRLPRLLEGIAVEFFGGQRFGQNDLLSQKVSGLIW